MTEACFHTKCRKDFLEFLIRAVFTKVFDVNIGEFYRLGAEL